MERQQIVAELVPMEGADQAVAFMVVDMAAMDVMVTITGASTRAVI
jgi:hypothetical protein